MQAPILIFDHIRKAAGLIKTGPSSDKKLDDLLASQRDQVATSGRPSN